MPASTVDRVPKHTAPHVNEWIRQKASARVCALAEADPEAIDRRLREPVLRRLGFRTAREIDIERNALKTLRGDFDTAATSGQQALRAAAL